MDTKTPPEEYSRRRIPAAYLPEVRLYLVSHRVLCVQRFSQPPEVFPKQVSIVRKDGSIGYGNFVRLFGRHYKRPHYSKVWDGEAWLGGEAAIEFILNLSGDTLRKPPGV